MSYPFLRPNDTSTGGAGGGANGGFFGGAGRVSVPIPPQSRPFPWPLPYSAQQGGIGGAGGRGMVVVQAPPWSQPYRPWGLWWNTQPEGWPQGYLAWKPIPRL